MTDRLEFDGDGWKVETRPNAPADHRAQGPIRHALFEIVEIVEQDTPDKPTVAINAYG